MSMKIVRLSSLLFALVLAAAAFCFDFPVLAGSVGQNANSATTAPENTNATTPTRRRSRRNRRRPAATTAEPAATSTPTETAAPPLAWAPTEHTDLSGTYTGTFDCADAGLSGATTLTITGNQFTLADGKTGRIVASTTRGYTGVAMQFGESTASTPTHPGTVPTIISMRAKKSGDRLTLMPVADSGRVCSFTPAGTSRITRARRTRAKATLATPAMPASPAEPPATPATPAEPATPATDVGPTPPGTPATPTRRGRRGRRGTQNTNTNMNSNTSTNDNTGEGNANARPTPTPAVPRN